MTWLNYAKELLNYSDESGIPLKELERILTNPAEDNEELRDSLDKLLEKAINS